MITNGILCKEILLGFLADPSRFCIDDIYMIYFYILFVVTAAGGVPCGSPKKRPRTSPIVQFIFNFWSFEISRNILRNQRI